MEKIKKRIANLKVAGKLKVYRMTVLVMTLFLVSVAVISTLVIRSNIEKMTEVWSPSLGHLQGLETMTAKKKFRSWRSRSRIPVRIWRRSSLQTVMLKKDRKITK